jgi:hypothetical protein
MRANVGHAARFRRRRLMLRSPVARHTTRQLPGR